VDGGISFGAATMRTFLLALLAGAWAQMPGEEVAKPNERPMSRIVGMLREMQAEMAHEQEEDDKLFKTFSCWCDETKRTKANDQENNEKAEAQLVASKKANHALAARLET